MLGQAPSWTKGGHAFHGLAPDEVTLLRRTVSPRMPLGPPVLAGRVAADDPQVTPSPGRERRSLPPSSTHLAPCHSERSEESVAPVRDRAGHALPAPVILSAAKNPQPSWLGNRTMGY